MRFLRRIVFLIERLLVRGAFYQLLVIAGAIMVISLAAGLVVHGLHPAFQEVGSAVWWAFLRLTDPGYLGDDEGALARTVSTIVTILGYVMFMGALIAIMTQALHRLMRRLEAGVTPITQRGHVLILGWTNRTPAIIRELLMSEGRVNRFLKRIKASRLRIVVLAQDVGVELYYDLKAELGDLWDSRKILLRTGIPLRLEHLQRVDFLNAAVIIVPEAGYGKKMAEATDARAIKTALSISSAAQNSRPPRTPPILITELRDAAKADLVRQAYNGPIEILPTSSIVSRLMAQNVRHRGLSDVYDDLLAHGGGSELYARVCPWLAGQAFGSVSRAYKDALPIGVLRQEAGGLVPLLNPPPDLEIRVDDRLAFIARTYDSIAERKSALMTGDEEIIFPDEDVIRRVREKKTIALLGWNEKVPSLIGELESYTRERFSVVSLSVVPQKQRRAQLAAAGIGPQRVHLDFIDGDYTTAGGLNLLPPGRLDNVIFLASDWLASEEEADARSVLGYLMLKRRLTASKAGTDILIELMDGDNESVIEKSRDEVLISPRIASHMLAHVALRPELELVFEELFTAEGGEIYFRLPSQYGVETGMTFAEIQRHVARRGDIALGVHFGKSSDPAARLKLNPPRDAHFELGGDDQIVVLTTYV